MMAVAEPAANGQPRLIACDVDGVLVHGMTDGRYDWQEALARDFGVKQEDVAAFFRDDWDACILGEADLRDVLPPYLERWGYGGTADDFLAFWFANDSNLDHDLVEEISGLRSHSRIVLATNQDRHRAAFLWDEMGLSSRFDRMFASSSMGVRKPDTQFWRIITDEMGEVAGPEVLLIDDSQRNVEAARQFGWQAIHYRDRSDLDRLLGPASACASS
ncbi:MAG: HAD-IA family hydrolase [Pseudomonadota bacterium]